MFIDRLSTHLDATFSFNGETVMAREGEILAIALLRHGVKHFRTTPTSGSPRAPFCMMGVCFDCLVTIDSRPNRQSCLERVRDGMSVEAQLGAAAPRDCGK